MQEIIDRLAFVTTALRDARNKFVNKRHDELVRFVFCAIDKEIRIVTTLKFLCAQVNGYVDHEFSIGILSRSLLMDMILTMEIKQLCVNHENNNKDELTLKVKKSAYKFISDGTTHIIEEIRGSEKYTASEKDNLIELFSSLFHEAFEIKNNSPKLKADYRVNLTEIAKNSLLKPNPIYNDILDLYRFYSKYDHLSHWTALSQSIELSKRLSRFETVSRLIVLHSRDLLSIGYDFCEGYKSLLPTIEGLQNYWQEHDSLKQS
ncbi:MAG: hypothetical protein JSS64_12160 [Bacteroidetes bacterium]|nr:hypothetical protein [Bacteroidota bacterium]